MRRFMQAGRQIRRAVPCVALQHLGRALCRYPEDGELSIDNNLSERALREPQAVGRKNRLFVGSNNGGRTAAVPFSMTAGCKRHGIDPFRYLADVLRRLPTTTCEQLVGATAGSVASVARPQAARKAGRLILNLTFGTAIILIEGQPIPNDRFFCEPLATETIKSTVKTLR